jgi:hypothetical protein
MTLRMWTLATLCGLLLALLTAGLMAGLARGTSPLPPSVLASDEPLPGPAAPAPITARVQSQAAAGAGGGIASLGIPPGMIAGLESTPWVSPQLNATGEYDPLGTGTVVTLTHPMTIGPGHWKGLSDERPGHIATVPVALPVMTGVSKILVFQTLDGTIVGVSPMDGTPK